MTDFGTKELEEYINERVKEHVIDNAEDLTFECLQYFVENSVSVDKMFTKEEMKGILADNCGSTEALIDKIAEKYGIAKSDAIKEATAIKEFSEVFDTVKDIYEIGSGFINLYESCKKYIVDGKDIVDGSQCIQDIFSLTSSIVGTVDFPFPLIGTLISEQFELGAMLLEKGTALAAEYNKRFEELDAIWEEIEAADNEIDSSLQEKINTAIGKASGDCETLEAAKWYEAIMKEYGWLFNMVDNEQTRAIKEQYARITSAMSAGNKFMSKYEEVFRYATVENYLGNENNKDVKPDGGDYKDAEGKDDPPKDPIILDLNNDGTYSKELASGVHFDYDGDGFAEKTGWTADGDGFLVRDINGDGVINDGSELFGDKTILADGTTAVNGFAALSDLDTNGDGVIDSADIAFSELKVWIDRNSDGITQADELYSLPELDIEKIILNYTYCVIITYQNLYNIYSDNK